MKSVSEFEGVFIHRDPVDMRKAINGLCAIVEEAMMGGKSSTCPTFSKL